VGEGWAGRKSPPEGRRAASVRELAPMGDVVFPIRAPWLASLSEVGARWSESHPRGDKVANGPSLGRLTGARIGELQRRNPGRATA